MVDYIYKDLYNKLHIDKQIKIIAFDFVGYEAPENKYPAKLEYEGKVYLNAETNSYYKCRKSGALYTWNLVGQEHELIIFKNRDIEWENFELSESLCSESELRFGCCEASAVKIKIHNNFIPLKDKWITITEILEGHTDATFQFGRYKVFSDVPTADRLYREITAYDMMYDIINSSAINWYNTILPKMESEVTMKQFRTSFVESFGLKQKDITLANDDMIVKKTIQVGEGTEIDNGTEEISILKESSLSGLDIIKAICEINGCFGHIGRDGNFHYIYLSQDIMGLYPSSILFPNHAPDYLPQAETGHLYPQSPKSERIGNGTYISADYEDFICRRINKLQIREKENDIGAQYPKEKVENQNTYIIEDNFLVYGKSAEELEKICKNIFEKIKNILYRPFTAEFQGNPCLEVGDPVRLATRYELIESYIVKRTLKGIQDLRDSCSAEGSEKYSEKTNSVSNSIIQLKGKTNTLERNVGETISKIEDVETGLSSRIEQSINSIEMNVSNGATSATLNLSVTKENGSVITGQAKEIKFSGLVSFENLAQNDGKTIINGGNITTGRINCDRLDGGSITGQTFKGGKIVGSNVEAESAYYIRDPDFDDRYKMAYIKADNTGDMELRIGRVSKNGFDSGYNYLAFKEISQDRSCHIYSDLLNAHCEFQAEKLYTSRHLQFMAESGEMGVRVYASHDGINRYIIGYLQEDRTSLVGLPASMYENEPTTTKLRGNAVVLGSAGSITPSDERLKNSFKPLDEFDNVYMDIEPCAFKYNNGTSGRNHFGAKAGNVKEAFEKHGYTMKEFGGFVQIKDSPKNEDYSGIDDPMGLIYTEFVMWNMHMIQKLYKKIEEQKKEIDSLKESVSFLMERVCKHE